jgi:hypothetical protein
MDNVIDFGVLGEKYVPEGGSLTITVIRCGNSAPAPAKDAPESGQSAPEILPPAEFAVAMAIRSKTGEDRHVSLRGTAAELSEGLFGHIDVTLEKASVLEQIKKETAKVDQEISKAEGDLKAKKTKAAALKGKMPAKIEKPKGNQPAEGKTDEAKLLEKLDGKGKPTDKSPLKPVEGITAVDEGTASKSPEVMTIPSLFDNASVAEQPYSEGSSSEDQKKEVAA